MNRRRWLGLLRLAFGLGLLAWVLTETSSSGALARLAGGLWVLPVFVLQSMMGAAVEAQRLVLLLRSQSVRLPFRHSLRLVLVSVLFGYVVPGGVGGDIVKIHGLGSQQRTRRVEMTTVVLIDRVVGLFSLLTVAVLAVTLLGSFRAAPPALQAVALSAGFGIIGIVLVTALAWSTRLRASASFQFVMRFLPLKAIFSRMHDAVIALHGHKPAVIRALGLTAVGHVTLMAAFVLAAGVLLPSAPSSLVAWLSLLALVANLLPVTPGGLGVGEAAFAAAFGLAGYSGGAQLLLAWRIGLIPLAVAGGILYTVGGRGVEDAPAPQ